MQGLLIDSSADRHPDHDSICAFRRINGTLLQSGFEQGLAMAAQMRVLKVGQVTLAFDGTKIFANASNHSAVSHGHATEQIERLEKQVAELLAKAEAADSVPLEDGLTLPEEIVLRQERTKRAEQTGKKPRKRAPKPPEESPLAARRELTQGAGTGSLSGTPFRNVPRCRSKTQEFQFLDATEARMPEIHIELEKA